MFEYQEEMAKQYKIERIEMELNNALEFLDREFEYGKYNSEQYDELKTEIENRIKGNN